MTTITAPSNVTLRVDPLRRFLAWVAPVGPLAMAGWALSIPYALTDEPARWIPKMAQETRVQLSFWMMLMFTITIGVGVIVTGLVARAGSPRLGTVGMVLAYVGFAAMGYGGIAYDAIAASMLGAGIDIPTIETALGSADQFTAPTVGGTLFIPLTFIGTLLLAIALWRGGQVPRSTGVLLGAAIPVILVGPLAHMGVNAIGFLMISAAFAVAGRRFAAPTPAGIETS